MERDRLDKALAKIEPTRRGAIKGMIAGTAFIVPLVTSFSMNGLALNQALALSLSPNSTLVGNPNQT
jgi:hypothetical protein